MERIIKAGKVKVEKPKDGKVLQSAIASFLVTAQTRKKVLAGVFALL